MTFLMKRILLESLEWGKALLVAFTISVLLTVFIMQPFTVSGSSMEPTLEGKDPFDNEKVGDKVMVFKSPYLLGAEPNYGDVVIINSDVLDTTTIKDQFLESPIIRSISGGNSEGEETYWVKRVIGKAGDTLQCRDGIVYRNGEALEEEYLDSSIQNNFGPITIEEGHLFVMGDNRNGSKDSRNIGPVPTENVLGKVVMRFYPFDKISFF